MRYGKNTGMHLVPVVFFFQLFRRQTNFDRECACTKKEFQAEQIRLQTKPNMYHF